MPYNDLPFTADQKDKILRLSQAGSDDELLSRQYGVAPKDIAEAIKDANTLRAQKQRDIDGRNYRNGA